MEFWDTTPHARTARLPGWLRVFARRRALRTAALLPTLTAFLIWSAFTPAVMARAASLAVCCALLILLALPGRRSAV